MVGTEPEGVLPASSFSNRLPFSAVPTPRLLLCSSPPMKPLSLHIPRLSPVIFPLSSKVCSQALILYQTLTL